PRAAPLVEVAVIRRARPSDALAIAGVQVASWHAAYRGLMPDSTLAAYTVEVREAAWQKILASPVPERPTTVFERDGRVIAFATVGPSRDDPEAGEVWALYAHPDAWSTGAGRALLEDGLAFLAAQRWPRVMLWVLDGNQRAIRFYQAAGFRLE